MLKRVIVIDCADGVDADGNPTGDRDPHAVINPEIVERQGSIVWEEGCLSVPDYTDEVERAETVTVTGLDRDGNPLRVEAGELLAICLQHEIDHLDGVLFVDRLSRLKKQLVKKRLRKRAAEEAS